MKGSRIIKLDRTVRQLFRIVHVDEPAIHKKSYFNLSCTELMFQFQNIIKQWT